MIRLIKNELFKMLHKKSTWITLLVIIGFITLVSVLNTFDFNSIFEEDPIAEVNRYESYIAELDKDSPQYLENLSEYEAYVDTYKLMSKYDKDSWQRKVIINDYLPLALQYYNTKDVQQNTHVADSLLLSINDLKDLLEHSDWKDVINIKRAEAQNKIEELNSQLDSSNNNYIFNANSIEYQKYLISLFDYRLKNDVEIKDSYLSNAIDDLINVKFRHIELKNKTNLDETEKSEFNDLNKVVLIDEYIINNKIDVNNYKSTKGVLESFFLDYSFLIVVLIVLVGSSLISDEYQKGTIKSLLITPYSRKKIIIAKYLSLIIMIPFVTVLLLIYQFILGGLLFGFSSLSIPVLEYNYVSGSLVELSILKYLGILFIYKLPYYLMLGTIAFTISTIISSSGGAIAITFFGLLGSSILNGIVIGYRIKAMKFIISLNWDFSQYLFGASPAFNVLTLNYSIIIYLIHLLVLLLISIIIFINRDIKNI
jgi:ABC-2 type transport system permease protein